MDFREPKCKRCDNSMIDAEKIKSVLEKCEINRREWCEECPYFGKWDCVSQLHKDVLDLMT